MIRMLHPVLLIALPLLAAFGAPLVNMLSRKLLKGYVLLVLVTNAFMAALLLYQVRIDGDVVEYMANFVPPVGIVLWVGELGAILALLINGLAAVNYISFLSSKKNELRFSMLYMLVTAASTGIVITGDLFNMFVFFEIASVGSYALVAYSGKKLSYQGAIKYIIMGSLGSTFILIGIALIYGELKTLNFYDIAARIRIMPDTTRLMAFTFLLTGIGVEAELFPLNGWVPDAYQGSDNRVAAFMVLGPSKAAIYAVARLLLTLSPMTRGLDIALFTGVLTLLIGEFAALKQKDPKRMLAYSSIAQMGLILVAFSLGTTEGIIAAVFLIISHAAAKVILFLGVRGYRAGSFRAPVLGTSMIVAVFSLVGLPPFVGFWGKWYLMVSLANSGLWMTMLVILGAVVVESIYYARFIAKGMKGRTTADPNPYDSAVILVIAAGLLLVGLFPGIVYNTAVYAASSLLGGGA